MKSYSARTMLSKQLTQITTKGHVIVACRPRLLTLFDVLKNLPANDTDSQTLAARPGSCKLERPELELLTDRLLQTPLERQTVVDSGVMNNLACFLKFNVCFLKLKEGSDLKQSNLPTIKRWARFQRKTSVWKCGLLPGQLLRPQRRS